MLEFGAVEVRRSWSTQMAENSARQARVTAQVQSSGAGEAVLAAPIVFGIGFLDVPSVATGYEVLSSLTLQHYPLAVCFVTSWTYNAEQTLCTGARVALVVDDDFPTTPLTHTLKHHLTFLGEAMKLLPDGAV